MKFIDASIIVIKDILKHNPLNNIKTEKEIDENLELLEGVLTEIRDGTWGKYCDTILKTNEFFFRNLTDFYDFLIKIYGGFVGNNAREMLVLLKYIRDALEKDKEHSRQHLVEIFRKIM